MEVIYDIHSVYWKSIYRKLFDAQGVSSSRIDRLELEQRLLKNEGVEIFKDPDGRWVSVKIMSQEDVFRLSLMYGE
jgi:hypothetical protein